MPEQTIHINGLKVNYRIIGNGRPIFILHGWNASSDSWAAVQRALAQQGFQVVVPDLPGFGKSAKPQKVWDLDDYCDFAGQFIDFLGYEKVILAGHSFGGRLAIKLAVKFPPKIEKLILIAAAGIKPKKHLRDYFALFLAKTLKPLSKLPGFGFSRTVFYKKFLRKTDYLQAKGIMKEIFKEVIKEDLRPVLSNIKTKTFIIWGREDQITPLKDGLEMKERIKNSEIVILENTGHAPNLKNPQLLSQKIKDFLR